VLEKEMYWKTNKWYKTRYEALC